MFQPFAFAILYFFCSDIPDFVFFVVWFIICPQSACMLGGSVSLAAVAPALSLVLFREVEGGGGVNWSVSDRDLAWVVGL